MKPIIRIRIEAVDPKGPPRSHGGLRVLSLVLGHKYAAACAVMETLSQASLAYELTGKISQTSTEYSHEALPLKGAAIATVWVFDEKDADEARRKRFIDCDFAEYQSRLAGFFRQCDAAGARAIVFTCSPKLMEQIIESRGIEKECKRPDGSWHVDPALHYLLQENWPNI